MLRPNQNRVIVLAIIESGLTPTEAVERFGISRQWVHTLLARYHAEGDAGLQPRSRRPRQSPTTTPKPIRDQIHALRDELAGAGLDAGAETIAAHLARRGLEPPSTSTIWRILRSAQQVTPQPQKRPRSSYQRFEAAQPNETWQSDFTHWPLADGTDSEIISWLDDHARYLLHISAHSRVNGRTVTTTFAATADQHGLPASTLTDNGMVYTARFARGGHGGPNAFEHLISRLGIDQKNGRPFHPQTQGKIERFHQTLKLWLSRQPRAATLTTLDSQLQQFRDIYNTQRPHRALNRRTPAEAYAALPKAEPILSDGQRHWRVRYDTVDEGGTITVRYAGKIRHLGIGRAHKNTPVTLLIAGSDTIVTNRATGEILAEHIINADHDYQAKK